MIGRSAGWAASLMPVPAVAVMPALMAMAFTVAVPAGAFMVGLPVGIFNFRRQGFFFLFSGRQRGLQARGQFRSGSKVCSMLSFFIALADARSRREQHVHNALIAVLCGKVQRRLPVGVARRHICPAGEQQGNKPFLGLNSHGSKLGCKVYLILQQQGGRLPQFSNVFHPHEFRQKFLYVLVKIIRVKLARHVAQFFKVHPRFFFFFHGDAVPGKVAHVLILHRKILFGEPIPRVLQAFSAMISALSQA